MSDKVRQEGSADGEVKSLSVTPALTALLKPTADYVGGELRGYVKATVEEWMARRREKNIKAHVDGVRQKLEDNPNESTADSAKFSQLSLFGEWLDQVQDVDPDDEELSEIWQNLLASAVREQAVRQEVLSAIKTLRPREARFLARMQEGALTVPPIKRIGDAEDRYLAKSLEERRIVEKDHTRAVSLASGLGLSGIAMYIFVEMPRMEFPPIMWILLITATMAAVGFWQRFGLAGWRLTWLGSQLVAYLPAGKEKKQQTPAQHGASADAAKPRD